VVNIVKQSLCNLNFPGTTVTSDLLGVLMFDFAVWLRNFPLTDASKLSMIYCIDWRWILKSNFRMVITIRDILSWCDFVKSRPSNMAWYDAYIHGATCAFLDGFGVSQFLMIGIIKHEY